MNIITAGMISFNWIIVKLGWINFQVDIWSTSWAIAYFMVIPVILNDFSMSRKISASINSKKIII